MKKAASLLLLCAIAFSAYTQSVGIGTTSPNASAQLEISSTGKGLLIPRMNSTAINAISNPAKGLMVLDTAKNQLVFNVGTPAAPNWQSIAFSSGWSTTGNAGTSATSNFIGTTDDNDVLVRRNNVQSGLINTQLRNTSWGHSALRPSATGSSNTAIGFRVLELNTTGSFNSSIGSRSMLSNTSGSGNTAVGYGALALNSTGNSNTAIGISALEQAKGSDNTAAGNQSLAVNGLGNRNSGFGTGSLLSNISGDNNTAIGTNSGQENIDGSNNVFLGYQAGQHETGSNKLYISNTDADASNALIYGEFDNKLLKINGSLTINAAPGAPGLNIGSAAIRVSGSNPSVFTVTATAAVLDLVIPNTTMANISTDILIVTHRLSGTKLNSSPGVYWNGTNWVIFLENFGNHIVGEQYNVMVIKQ